MSLVSVTTFCAFVAFVLGSSSMKKSPNSNSSTSKRKSSSKKSSRVARRGSDIISKIGGVEEGLGSRSSSAFDDVESDPEEEFEIGSPLSVSSASSSRPANKRRRSRHETASKATEVPKEVVDRRVSSEVDLCFPKPAAAAAPPKVAAATAAGSPKPADASSSIPSSLNTAQTQGTASSTSEDSPPATAGSSKPSSLSTSQTGGSSSPSEDSRPVAHESADSSTPSPKRSDSHSSVGVESTDNDNAGAAADSINTRHALDDDDKQSEQLEAFDASTTEIAAVNGVKSDGRVDDESVGNAAADDEHSVEPDEPLPVSVQSPADALSAEPDDGSNSIPDVLDATSSDVVTTDESHADASLHQGGFTHEGTPHAEEDASEEVVFIEDTELADNFDAIMSQSSSLSPEKTSNEAEVSDSADDLDDVVSGDSDLDSAAAASVDSDSSAAKRDTPRSLMKSAATTTGSR